MKPTSLTALKRFPLTDYNYHSVTISGYRGRCAKSAPPSFRNISRQYFQNEARRDFVCEAVVFAMLIITATPQRKQDEERIVRPAGFTPNLASMDVPRVGVAAKKRKRRVIIIAASALGLILATIAISRLKPAVPSVDRSSVWIDTVKRGPMVRQVRGLGTLVPEDIRWIPANTEGRVEKIMIWPGTHVEPDSVILELTSPELEQSANDAELRAKGAEGELKKVRATLQRELLDQESKTTAAPSAFEQAKMERQ